MKILIIRLKAIGDTVLTTPVFRHLKRMFPDSKIDVIIYPYVYDVLKKNPYIDRIILLKRDIFHKLLFYFKSIFKYYDVIIDCINNPTSVMIAFFTHSKIRIGNKNKRNRFYSHRLEINERMYSAIRNLKLISPLGLKDFSDYMTDFFIDDKDRESVDDFFKNTGLNNKKLIGIFASAKYITRRYIPEYFARIADLIVQNSDYNILFLFGKEDINTMNIIKKSLNEHRNIYFASPNITIGELAAIIERVNFFITADTGPKHIANALKIPTLTIFSATYPEDWNPPDLKKYPYIKNNIECSPCDKLVCNSLKCMKELSPETIFEKIKEFIF